MNQPELRFRTSEETWAWAIPEDQRPVKAEIMKQYMACMRRRSTTGKSCWDQVAKRRMEAGIRTPGDLREAGVITDEEWLAVAEDDLNRLDTDADRISGLGATEARSQRRQLLGTIRETHDKINQREAERRQKARQQAVTFYPVAAVAELLGVHNSTVTAGPGGSLPDHSHRWARLRRRQRGGTLPG
jgi:hypothetical protein